MIGGLLFSLLVLQATITFCYALENNEREMGFESERVYLKVER